MFDPATAAIGGSTLLNSILGLVGSGQQGTAARQGADIQSKGYDQAINQLTSAYGQARQGMSPYAGVGGQAMGRLGSLAGVSSAAPVKPQAPDKAKYTVRDSWGNEHFSQELYDAAQDDYTKSMENYNQELGQYQLSGGGAQGQMQAPTVGGMTPSQAYGQYSQPTTVGGMSPAQAYQKYTGDVNIDVTKDPGYQFRLQQGTDALEKSAAAKGGFFSGQTGKDLTNYAQNLAAQEYQNAYNREMGQRQMGLGAYGQAYGQEMGQKQFGLGAYGQAYGQEAGAQQDKWNRLSSLAGMGQQAATQTGQWGLNTAGQTGQWGVNSAQAQAQGLIGQAGAQNSGMQNVGNQITSGLGSVMQYSQNKDLINQMKNNPYAYGPGY